MPNHTVSGNVDTMMRAADNAAIRSAIGVGTTDAPTFLAQTLTGQSLTASQATSLVDLATTWNTSGTPTAIKLNVVETGINSNAASLLMDLQVDGVSKIKALKNGSLLTGSIGAISGALFINSTNVGGAWIYGSTRIQSGLLNFNGTTYLHEDASGILAQRNLSAPQTLRVYNSTDATPATNFDRASFGFTSNTLRIGTENGGTYTLARPIEFVTGGVAKWQISAAGHLMSAGVTDNAYDIGASGANRPRSIYVGTEVFVPKITVSQGNLASLGISFGAQSRVVGNGDGILLFGNSNISTFDRFQLGGITSAFPAIKRNGTGIDIVLANDSGFAPVKGKLTTDTNYTAGVPSATGYLTIYDATGTAYRVPCTV